MHGKGSQELQALQREVRRAQEEIDNRDLAEAKERLLKVRAECARLGVHTAHVAWMLAIVGDYMGDASMAVQFIQEALRADPMSLGTLRSFDIIATHLREALTDADRPVDAENTPKLYGLLQELGEVDVPCHLVMARHEAHAGKTAEALRRVEAVLLLNPQSREAWALKAELATALGDAEAAQAARVEAAALGAGVRPVPFAMPGVAQG